jgi:hypothetical protein
MNADHQTLSIYRNTWLRNTFGPIAFAGNELVLNSSRSDFLSRCQNGSNILVPQLVGIVTIVDRFAGAISTSDGVINQTGFGIQFKSLPGLNAS